MSLEAHEFANRTRHPVSDAHPTDIVSDATLLKENYEYEFMEKHHCCVHREHKSCEHVCRAFPMVQRGLLHSSLHFGRAGSFFAPKQAWEAHVREFLVVREWGARGPGLECQGNLDVVFKEFSPEFGPLVCDKAARTAALAILRREVVNGRTG